ncbi:hypothetical protein NDU88_011509, partial [Pleurodeles waltl]
STTARGACPWCSLPPELLWSYPSAPPQPEELVFGAHYLQSCLGPTLQLHNSQRSLSLLLTASRAAVVLPSSSTTARGACL